MAQTLEMTSPHILTNGHGLEMPWLTINDLIDQQAHLKPDAPAVVFLDGGATLTRRELRSRVVALAAGLRRQGVGKGDRVLTVLRNSPEQLFTWLACARLGALFTPVNVGLKVAELAHAIRVAEPSVIVVARDRVAVCRETLLAVEHTGVLLLSTSPTDESDPPSLWSLVDGDAADDAAFDRVGPEDTVALLFTSGTTGLPKAVTRSHFSSVCGAMRYQAVFEPGRDHRHLCNGQLFHSGAQEVGFLGPLMAGASSNWAEWFSASLFWERVRESGATATELSGPLISFLLRQPPHELDAQHNLRSAISALHGLDDGVKEEFQRRFNVPNLLEIYAMTETGMMLFSNTVSDRRAGSVGKSRGWCEVQIADDADRPLPIGTSGQILLRPSFPHSMTSGYHGRPDVTATFMRNCWIHTGDIGHVDDEGWLYFDGRPSERIRRRGENISAREVEAVIGTHPAVAECVVIGVPSELGDEEVEVVVCLAPGAKLDFEEFVRWCDERLASFKVPRFIRMSATPLPRTAVKGDVERHTVKSWPKLDVYDRQSADRMKRNG